ncbi:C-X-C chemokine receptor type 3-like [Anableps anableps]
MEEIMNPSEESPWWGNYLDYFSNDWNYSYYGDFVEENFEGDNVCDLSSNFVPVFILVLYSVAFVVGTLGNTLLLGVLIKSRKIWGITDTFILHLAVADILLLMTLPFWTSQSASGAGWVFGTFFCKVTGSVFTINFYCGIFLLVCISVSYYLSIVHSTKVFTQKSWMIHASCLLVWLFSVLLSIPDWIFLEDLKDPRRGNKSECIRNYKKFDLDDKIYKMAGRGLYHTLGFVLPSIALVFCYSGILWQLHCGTKSLQKQRAFKVIIAVVAVFFLCWTPYNITLWVDTVKLNSRNVNLCETETFLEKALTVTSALGYFHCCLNPILLLLLDVKCRRQLLNMWTKTSYSSVF